MLALLCRLTHGERGSLGHFSGTGTDFDELNNIAGSRLEKVWLRYIKDNSYRLPDRGQTFLEEFDTRPDFAYTTHQALVYTDGPHHCGDRGKTLDPMSPDAAGFTVVRFEEDRASWDNIVDEYAWVFGPGTSSAAK